MRYAFLLLGSLCGVLFCVVRMQERAHHPKARPAEKVMTQTSLTESVKNGSRSALDYANQTHSMRNKRRPRLIVDVNSADEFELEELPGLQPPDAESIIENRPYRSRDELLTKQILPEDLYETIKDNLSPP